MGAGRGRGAARPRGGPRRGARLLGARAGSWRRRWPRSIRSSSGSPSTSGRERVPGPALVGLRAAARRGRDGRARAAALAAGCCGALAILTRETRPLLPAPGRGSGSLWRRGARRARAARAALLARRRCSTVAPWTYRNWVAFRAFVPVSTAGGLNLFQGNALIPRRRSTTCTRPCRAASSSTATRARGPGGDPRPPAVVDLREAARADADVLGSGEHGAHPHQARRLRAGARRRWRVAVAVVVLAPYLAVLALFVLGLRRCTPAARRPAARRLPRRTTTCIHVVTHGFAATACR